MSNSVVHGLKFSFVIDVYTHNFFGICNTVVSHKVCLNSVKHQDIFGFVIFSEDIKLKH